jgi:hypothetical protein
VELEPIVYTLSIVAIVSSVLAVVRPSVLSFLAAGTVNAMALFVWLQLF